MGNWKSAIFALGLSVMLAGPDSAWARYVLTRYEHFATFTQVRSQFTDCFANNDYSIAGMGNADGSVIERLDYSSTGNFAGSGSGPVAFCHDADGDFDLDMRDFLSFRSCLGRTDPECLAVHDFDAAGASDGDVDLDDYARFYQCFRGPYVTPAPLCGQFGPPGPPPPSGTLTLHGRAVDVLSDGHALMDFRARTYLPQLGAIAEKGSEKNRIPRNMAFSHPPDPILWARSAQ